MDLARLTPPPQALEDGEFSPLSRRRLVAVERARASGGCPEPLNAALLWRQVAQAVKAVTSPFPYPQVPVRLAVNPKGILDQSPGLRGTSYPGNAARNGRQPQGGCGGWRSGWAATPLGLCLPRRCPQGRRGAPTLGFATESLWDSQISASKLWVRERTCHRFHRFGDVSPKQGRVQRLGTTTGRPRAFNGDKSPARKRRELAALQSLWLRRQPRQDIRAIRG